MLTFPEAYNVTTPAATALVGVCDRLGNVLQLTRDGAGQLTQIQTVHGRFESYRVCRSGGM